ncbi:MAG: hypothetical protein Q8P93_04140 [bacterium]|nr:hypothetical protein [bacterium]
MDSSPITAGVGHQSVCVLSLTTNKRSPTDTCSRPSHRSLETVST